MFYLKTKLLNLLQYRVVPPFKKYLEEQRQASFQNIGKNINGKNAPKALVIYIPTAIPYLISGDVYTCPLINNHALIWHAAELVRVLIENGYVVDFVDCYIEGPKIDWYKYELVFDERNNLINAPEIKGQRKIFYATGLPWDFQNSAEVNRIYEFQKRTKIWLNPMRTVRPIFSDKVADYIFFYGRPEWMEMFSSKPIRHQLNISSTYVPTTIKRNYARRNFLWMGSVGAVHKGLDLAVEAFKDIPEAQLNIFGNIKGDVLFFSWLTKMMEKYPNIKYQGVANVSGPEFQKIAEECVGHVFPSCSENGAGSVGQTSLFGIIPIATDTSNSRSMHLGYVINERDTDTIIAQIKRNAKNVLELSEPELKAKSDQLIEFSRKVHTRAAYTESLNDFFKILN